MLLDWPLAQYGLGALPWLVSLWVDAPLRYWLWGVGIVIDLVVLLLASGERALQEAEERLERVKGSRRRGGPAAGLMSIEGTHTEEEHLAERLGLFVIIVLGEGLIQIIDAAADSASWDRSDRLVVALGAFALLASVWTAGLLHGTAGIPQLTPHVVAPRIVMLLHALLTGSLAALAAALGVAVEHTHEALPDGVPGAAVRCGGRLLRARRGDRPAGGQGTAAGSSAVACRASWCRSRCCSSGPTCTSVLLVWILVAVVVWLVLEKPADGRPRRESRGRCRPRQTRTNT